MKAVQVQLLCEEEDLDHILDELKMFIADEKVRGMEVVAYQIEANPSILDPAMDEDGWEMRVLH